MAQTITISLPPPPSVNSLFVNIPRRGRVKSKGYKNWLANADAAYWVQHMHKIVPIIGPREVCITLPNMRGDIDNYAKATLDFLVSRKLTGDDRFNVKVTLQTDASLTDCLVEVKAA